jgi:hypothetical protein
VGLLIRSHGELHARLIGVNVRIPRVSQMIDRLTLETEIARDTSLAMKALDEELGLEELEEDLGLDKLLAT